MNNSGEISTGQIDALLGRAGLPGVEARRKLLKAAGMTGKEAFAAAKVEAVAALRAAGVALPGDAPPAASASSDAAQAMELVDASAFAGRRCPRPKEIGWVADSLAVKDVGPEQAPSPGAWAMLQWARAEPRRFFEGVYTALLPTRSSLDGGGVPRDADDPEWNGLAMVRQLQEIADEAKRDVLRRDAALREEVKAELRQEFIRRARQKGVRNGDNTD